MCSSDCVFYHSEFKTKNIGDSLQIQLCKLFGHHPGAYTFGNGAMDFPQYMTDKHPSLWRGMDRIVGSRSLVFMRNALVHYYMAPFYLEWTNYGTYIMIALLVYCVSE